MQRRSERIKQSGKSMRTKQRANRKTPVEIESSHSESSKEEQTTEVPMNVVFPEEMGEPSSGKEKIDQTEEETGEPQKEVQADDTETIAADQPQKASKGGGEEGSKPKKRKSIPLSKKDSKKPKVSTPGDAESSKKKKKKKSGKESEIPGEWFLNLLVIKDWNNGFKDRTLANCSIIDPELLETLNFKALKNLKGSQFRKMFNVGSEAYPRLTRLFYLNMTSSLEKEGLVIRSVVGGVFIEITQEVIAKALKMKLYNKDLPDKKTCLEEGKKLFLLPGGESGRQLTQSKLNCEGRILFTILVWCIVPKASSKELVTDKMLELMYLISEGFKINVPAIMMDHMISCSSKGRKHSLPYGNILPLIFEYLNIPIENEEKVIIEVETLDEMFLARMGMCLTKDGNWKFFADLTAQEKGDKKFVKPRSTTPASTSANVQDKGMMEKLEVLSKQVVELAGEVKSLSEDFVGFKLQLDEIHKLLKSSLEDKKGKEKVSSESEEDTSKGSDEGQDSKGKKVSGEERMEESESEEEDDGTAF